MKALDGKLIQISLGEPPDYGKLSLPKIEFERAMLTICMTLVRAGAKVVYGGDLRPDGYTIKIFRHLAAAYADVGQVPFIHILSQRSFLKMNFETLVSALAERHGVCSTMICLSGQLTDIWYSSETLSVKLHKRLAIKSVEEFESWQAEIGKTSTTDDMGIARAAMAAYVNGCIAIGGKMGVLGVESDQYHGEMPGVMQEAIFALELGKPVVALGAYGGATRDLAIALGLLDKKKRVPRGKQAKDYADGIAKAAQLKPSIPDPVIDRLRSIADDDRAEILARDSVTVLRDWSVRKT